LITKFYSVDHIKRDEGAVSVEGMGEGGRCTGVGVETLR
jgi:hypothetical protein